jgi:hypothetical protein
VNLPRAAVSILNARAEFYVLVGRRFGWKEGNVSDTRSPKRVSNRGETSLEPWRRRADRSVTVFTSTTTAGLFRFAFFFKEGFENNHLTPEITQKALRCD